MFLQYKNRLNSLKSLSMCMIFRKSVFCMLNSLNLFNLGVSPNITTTVSAATISSTTALDKHGFKY